MQELSGTTVTANSLMGGIDEAFQRTDSAGARTFLTDALGSSIALTDSTGTVQTQYTFDPFGNTTTSGSGTTNSFAYTGRELDATGLYFNRARYYSPPLQRFISEDPVGFAGGINKYAYVGNSPTNFSDSLGLSPMSGRSCGKDPCQVPPHPWYASVDVNILEAVGLGPVFQFFMVLPHMPWDYKQQGPYDDFGNFNFGATGAGLGYPDEVLLRGAGALKVIERRLRHQPDPPDIGSPFGDPPYGNEREKNIMIKRGIDYFKKYCWLPVMS